ncbi:hypothetical protein P0Y67_05960 [Photobacterium sp. SP02]|uniref:hypothetical protein n=1 Tax=Photobacterium sp. SP02 TaxID=3032280 RepID=UPI003144EA34
MKINQICKLTILCLSLFWSATSVATDAIYCPYTKVLELQVQPENVLVHLEGQGWKQLGTYLEPALDSRVSIVLAAHASGKQVMMAFPLSSGIECEKTNYGVSPYKVRIR